MYNSMCTAIDANFANWGKCFTAGMGLGSEVILAIVLFGLLMYIVYKFNIPTEAAIVIGVGMIFAMGINFGMLEGGIMEAVMVLVMLAIATLIVLAALKFAKR